MYTVIENPHALQDPPILFGDGKPRDPVMTLLEESILPIHSNCDLLFKTEELGIYKKLLNEEFVQREYLKLSCDHDIVPSIEKFQVGYMSPLFLNYILTYPQMTREKLEMLISKYGNLNSESKLSTLKSSLMMMNMTNFKKYLTSLNKKTTFISALISVLCLYDLEYAYDYKGSNNKTYSSCIDIQMLLESIIGEVDYWETFVEGEGMCKGIFQCGTGGYEYKIHSLINRALNIYNMLGLLDKLYDPNVNGSVYKFNISREEAKKYLDAYRKVLGKNRIESEKEDIKRLVKKVNIEERISVR